LLLALNQTVVSCAMHKHLASTHYASVAIVVQLQAM